MKTDYCAYLPRLAADLEITEQRDGERTVYVVGSASVGRYLLLRATEHRVMSLIDGARAAGDVCATRAEAALDLDHRFFRGVVSKIGGESETDRQGQATYRVELTIENGAGLLRPGMTAFARIDFDRRMVGRILLHKVKQALRPELWML